MLMFIRVEIANCQIVAVEAMRVMTNWTTIAVYATKVGEQSGIETAIRPIGMMLMRSDRVIFATQEERDVFINAAKRWIDKPILARSGIIPPKMLKMRPSNLRMLIKELRKVGLSVEELAKCVIER